MSTSSEALDARGLPPGTQLRPNLEVTPRDAKAAVDAGTALLVDVRTPEEWDLVRIPGSVLVPLNELAARHDEIEPSPGQQVLLLCHHGRRSLDAALQLRALGRPELQACKSVAGGIEVWSLAADTTIPRYERGPGVLRRRP